ncbi:GD13006 [Drosophila simulans]|uniref:GD13006 n=1 Tax=Drosophila simulans TaxID=7240 RepID=B4QLL3_DROSI|nr:GD13006 [Drosophila simulans]
MDTIAGESQGASPPSSNEAAAGSQSQSDVSEEEEYLDNSIELRGYLSKWTNYIYGWQPRYIVLKDGTLSYYKSESESDFGCRGAISLTKATIKAHESDELRFDVVVNNLNNWCLRAETSEDRMHWVDVLQLYKADSGSTDTTSLRRHGSTMSLQSNTISLTSGGSLKKTQRNLREKVGELETFKDILFGQIETLQRYFDACSEVNKNNAQPLDLGDGLKSIDFKGESITFRATTSGVLTTLQHCLEIIAESDESWKRKLEREIDKRRRSEDQSKKLKDEVEKMKRLSYPGPDFEIDRVCKEQLHYAREGVGQDGNGWQIFADEGEIKMYKREEEVNGLVMDPLKAYHTVQGVTAREMCHYFFMPEFRNDWEINPGGWAPASALRAVYKREYPKFLKRFTGYVIDQCKDKPIMF